MIRVFNAAETAFNTNGEVIIKPLKANITNNDNGDFFLQMACGVEYNDFIQPNNIIVAPTPTGAQAFRISEIQKNKKRLEVKAWHLFYDSENYLIADSYAVNMNCNDAINHFNAATDTTSPFLMYSDINTIYSMREVRKSLAECVNDVIERWGGHLKRNNWEVSILQNAGTDHGVTIEYKKNLEDLTAIYNWDRVVTKLMPVGKDGILIDGRYVYSAVQYDIPYTKCVSFEQDINAEEYPTETDYINALKADLLAQATAYVNKYCYPVVNYTLKGNPEKITDIGDIIEVKDERIGVDILTEVISYEYNAITGKYINLEFGNFTNTLSDLLPNIAKETTNAVNIAVGDITSETNRIYELLQAHNVVYRGYDVLLLDETPAEDAVNVLRINKNGLALSTDGVNGIFNTIYDLNYKRLRVNDNNVIWIYDPNGDVIGSINTGGVTLAGGEYLTFNGASFTDILSGKQNTLTAGPGIDLNNDIISLAKYQAGAVIINATLSGSCIVDNNGVSFEIDIDKPADGVEVYALDITIFDGTPTMATVTQDGAAETGYTVTITPVTTTKYKLDILTPLTLTDGGYILKYNIQLKAL